jgi:hypothetical protein
MESAPALLIHSNQRTAKDLVLERVQKGESGRGVYLQRGNSNG